MCTIPQELVDEVFGHLHDDRVSLMTMSLVCRSWHSSSLTHIFYRLELSVFESTKETLARDSKNVLQKYDQLCHLLERSPEIHRHIRELVINRANCLGSSLWKHVESKMVEILRKLTRVRRILVREMYWSHLSTEFQTTLSSICRSETLLHMDIWNSQFSRFTDFTCLLTTPFGLKSLRISYVRTGDDGGNFGVPSFDSHAIHSSVCLESLTIESCSSAQIVQWLASPNSTINLSNLRELYFMHVDNLIASLHLLKAAGSSLQHLEIWAPSNRATRNKVCNAEIDLSQSHSLRFFRLAGVKFTEFFSPAVRLSEMFQRIKAPFPLEYFHLILDVEKKGDTQQDWCQWEELDRTLAHPYFCALRHVQFDVCLASTKAKKRVLACMEKRFPLLHTRGILHIRCI